jgi:hypothetical protein
MADITVVAHSRKSFGGGLPELREILAREGVTDPLWYEVKKSRRAPRCAPGRRQGGGRDVRLGWRRYRPALHRRGGRDGDGRAFFKGKVSCVLAANVGKILGGVEAFPQARPDDGRLELGVVTARNPAQWGRTFGRIAVGHPDRSPFVKVTQGKKFRIRFDQKVRYELDGGTRSASKELRIKVRPSSVTVCVPGARDE